jgi:hypothetical protein
MKVGLFDLHPVVCVSESPPINFWMPEPIRMKLGMYIMAPDPISTAYFINPSHKSVCLYVYSLSLLGKGWVKCIPPFIARQRLGRHVPAAANTRNSRRIVGRVYLWVCLCIALSLLFNSVKTFPWEGRIVGGVVFYAVRVVTKEGRRLIVPRTSCLMLWICL